jgi:hypothetical protein
MRCMSVTRRCISQTSSEPLSLLITVMMLCCVSLQVSLPTQYNNRNQDPVGALSSALARLQSNRPLRELREVAKGITKQLPQPIQV